MRTTHLIGQNACINGDPVQIEIHRVPAQRPPNPIPLEITSFMISLVPP